ncbi:MAG: glycosyltransferase family 2 protein [Salinibacterium sp.]|nr:MAG: glycosyltransferase family 2 protein [Salinibacterium sp.]
MGETRTGVVAVVPTMGGDIARLTACIGSLKSSLFELDIVCVVNSSTIDPAELSGLGVRVEIAGVNLGWAGGMIFGAEVTDAPLIWFVQDDMTVRPETLGELVSALDADPSLGMVGPLSVGEDGQVPAGSSGGLISDDGKVISWSWYPVEPCSPEDPEAAPPLSYLPNRGTLVRRSAFEKCGGTDPRLYPAQYVDVDLSMRMRANGFTFALVPRALISHSGSGSTPRAFVEFLHSRNLQRFMMSWFPGRPTPDELYFPVYETRPDPVARPPHGLHPRVSDSLALAVLQSASDSLTHLARVFTATHIPIARERDRLVGELEAANQRTAAQAIRVAELEAAHAELRRSTSWRLTGPLRRISRLAARALRRG